MSTKSSKVAKAAAAALGRETHELTELRNAERFVELHGGDVRFVGTWRKWLVWDGSRWCLDDRGAAMALAADAARALLAEAKTALLETTAKYAEAAACGDDKAKAKIKEANAFLIHAVRSQGKKAIENMLSLAQIDSVVAISHEQLDVDPWLLNVANGTINLRTGELRPFARENLITKVAPVAYAAAAKCPIWDAFLARAMDGNVDLVAFLQRVFGYSLTGSIREHALGFFFGGGANGKTTALTTIAAMLGDYASAAPRGLLFRARGERHETELTVLCGRRFVVCSEIEAGRALDEALVKDLTGGDQIIARRMREDHWSFAPTHKLFIAGNHKPTVKGEDDGIWRRLRLVPWTVTIPPAERDKDLPEKLRAEMPGILAWCVAGCLAWQRDGLGDPAEVTKATSDYRAESDTLGQFFADELVFGTGEKVTKKELRERYAEWCEEIGCTPVGAKRFAERLAVCGVTATTMRVDGDARHAWAGVRLATADDREARCSGVASSSHQDPGDFESARARAETNRKSVDTSGYTDTARASHDGDADDGPGPWRWA